MDDKILLVNLPFWSPLIPAQGIASLKAFLQKYDYNINTVDAAADVLFLEYYKKYFDVLMEIVPHEKRGNFYNIGHDVIRNHCLGYVNQSNECNYDLIKEIIYNYFFINVDKSQTRKLNDVIVEYFSVLKNYFLEIIKDYKPEVFGLSVNSGNLAPSMYLSRIVKEYDPNIKTVMGGSIFFNHLCEGSSELSIFLEVTVDTVDKIFIGKSEILLLKYLKNELINNKRIYSLNDIAEKEQSQYKIDIPDISDYNIDSYLYLSASGSKGCPNNCSFCNSNSFFGSYMKKEINQTTNEISVLYKKYSRRLFFMGDSLLNPIISELSKSLIQQNLPVYFDSYFCVDEEAAKIENTVLWRNGGFYRARLGVESGSQKILDEMQKNISPDLIKRTLSALAYAGIKTTAYIVIGHPGETDEDFQKTLELVEECKDDIWQVESNPFTYYPGSSNDINWMEHKEPLYSDESASILRFQTWQLNKYPNRKTIYERVIKFAEFCNNLGIPNPYKMREIEDADQRWKKLHENAVPSVIDISSDLFDHKEKLNVIIPRYKKTKFSEFPSFNIKE